MILTKLSALLALSVLAAATPWGATTTSKPPATTTVTITETTTATPASQCDTGSIQCCNSIGAANSEPYATVLKGLGVAVQDVNVPVSLTCSSVTVAGLSSGSCNSQAVCCENNSFNGVVAIGCVPIIINA